MAKTNDRTRQINFKIWIKRGAWAVAAALLVWLVMLGIKNTKPQGPDRSQAIEGQGQGHIAVGVAHEPYNSNPPTSGPHYANPARTGFYSEVLPDEQLVHNLEHGEIWIAYRPGLPAEVIEQLKDYPGVFVIVTPREQNETDIALVAWERLDKFNLEGGRLDTQRIADFILRYRDKGPEKVHSAAGMVR